ncbi:MAG: 2,3-bisphosphoglycerate-independent phosphoglycerate mutase [Holosporales bacterium]|jgi:2,3-bisphosphoglycerate-independent phosphoglycerate mutase|nr:2,3-bisphosphoglycerate-independent phosphoglycerate mutase [Holosporales bacterium]
MQIYRGSEKKLLLCILDGIGYSSSQIGNATLSARFITDLMNSVGSALLEASGEVVGLPPGQCGNSEVGHLTIGAGRILKQKLPLINEAIKSRELDNNKNLNDFVTSLDGKTCHVMGLFSKGGVHSDIDHFFWAIDYLRQRNVVIKSHLFLDGRDVGYRDAFETLDSAIRSGRIISSEIATIQGRFYAMDRDNRFERTRAAFGAIVQAKTDYKDDNPLELIKYFYDLGMSDETIPPFTVADYEGAADGDGFWMLNFRTDRIKQILTLLQDAAFRILNMVSCDEKIDSKALTLFKQNEIKNTLGEIIAKNGLKQLRVAETEKYAHVTYFFNGGGDIKYENEDRILVPSPQVDDYSETPDMSSEQVSCEIIEAIRASKHEIIVANFANADMLGHTGNLLATKQSLSSLDSHIYKIMTVAQEYGYCLVLTSDHGNSECMMNEYDQSIHKSHTCSKVPFIILSNGKVVELKRKSGQLADIAPTIVDILGIDIPQEMTGASLL